ncbi:DNA polymerase III subunit beta, partial [gut metagenome]
AEHEDALEHLDIAWTYEELDMGFNITYLMEVLNLLKNKEVSFNFSSASGSVLITMPEAQERFSYVVMPMRI